MWSYHPDLLAKPVPRYTSYPTAMEFTGNVGADDYARALDAIEAANLKPIIDREFPLSEIAEAFRHQESGKHFGKICLTF